MSTNPDLAKERLNCPFNQEELTNFLNGGPNKTKFKRAVIKKFLESEAYKNCFDPSESLSAQDRYDQNVKNGVALYQTSTRIARELGAGPDQFKIIAYIGAVLLTPEGTPFALHFDMFVPALKGQATKEQAQKWIPKAMNLDILGTYAQTELGHGTFIRGLETTATYDAKTQEFVINSPSITSYKWWPGGLGKTANHALVMCQLVIDGEKKGPHPFMVQLRDLETHKSLDGVDLGEIGHKLSFNAYDNGFLGFENLRIPRTSLLSKNANVLPDGTYVKPPHSKSSYSTMVLVRVMIVKNANERLKMASIIATRYSSVRRQSELYPGKPEPQIIDYQTQQWKLFPYIALSVGFSLASDKLWESYDAATAEITAGSFKNLPELHALSSGLKALVTSESADGIDVLRRACGGHGFMSASGLPRIWGLTTASSTYEGENTVLLLQTARFLHKSFLQSKNNGHENLSGSVAYLNKPEKKTGINLESISGIVEAFEATARGHITQISMILSDKKRKSVHPADAWNSCSQELVEASLSHLRYFVISSFANVLTIPNVSDDLKAILTLLLRMSALFWIKKHPGEFMAFANLQPSHLTLVNEMIREILTKIRPLAVSIVDSFDIPDEMLGSTLGAYDGNVYERMLKQAKKSPLNQTDVLPTFEKTLKPLIKSNL